VGANGVELTPWARTPALKGKHSEVSISRFLGRLRASTNSLTDEAWRARTAWKMATWRKRAEQLRIEHPDEYQRILGLAIEEGQRLAEIDPDGFVAFVLADSRNPRSTNRADGPR
jgi:hypothetical protein